MMMMMMMNLYHTVVAQLFLMLQCIPRREQPVAITDLFHAQMFRLHQNVPRREHINNNNHGHQVVIHSHHGPEFHEVKCIEIFMLSQTLMYCL